VPTTTMRAISRDCTAAWLLVLLIGSLAGRASAETSQEEGNDTVPVPQGWQDTGIGAVLNHPSRALRQVGPGYEQFYYRGDARALNDILRRFAATELPVREVALQPGVARTWAVNQGRSLRYDWDLRLLTLTTLVAPQPPAVDPHRGQKPYHLGEVVAGRRHPSLAVFVGAASFHLCEIDIPAGITVVGPAELRERYVQALGSDDSLERGEAACCLAQLEPYNEANLRLFVAMLKGQGHGPYFSARALRTMGPLAEAALPVLRAELPNQDEVTAQRFRDAIDWIGNHKVDQRVVDAYWAGVAEISDFLARPRSEAKGLSTDLPMPGCSGCAETGCGAGSLGLRAPTWEFPPGATANDGALRRFAIASHDVPGPRPLGLQVHFVDVWGVFLCRGGEIHCGTNAIRRVSLR
jgi:hypothetical protein